MESDQGNLLVIGARSLVGRRLREAVTGPEGWKGEVRFTSRQQLANQSLVLDFTHPEAFQPGMAFENVIFCTPVWLGGDRLFDHLKSLGMRRLVAFSSTSLFTKERSGNEAERGVVRQLLDGEKSTIDFCERNGVAWTILRPTLIYDEGQDENVSRIASTIRKLGFFPVCPPASGLRQPVHARDLAVAALKALRSKAAEGHAYNLAGGESLTYRAMVARIFEAMGRRPAIVAVPEGAWRLLFGILKAMQPHRDLKQNLDMALRMNRDLWFDSAQATRDFGYAPNDFRPVFTVSSGR
jgi:nucleoside-diphosphate-sugar epimerase